MIITEATRGSKTGQNQAVRARKVGAARGSGREQSAMELNELLNELRPPQSANDVRMFVLEV